MSEAYPILFLLMRTDIASMNPGKAIAQGSHAANAAVADAEIENEGMLADWAGTLGFGTVVTLDGGSIDNIRKIMAEAKLSSLRHNDALVAAIVEDPTYPLRDGSVVHHFPLETCAYAMCYSDSEVRKVFKNLPMYK